MNLSGWVGVELGGNCDCRCGILYASMLGGDFAGLFILTSSPYSSELFVFGGGLVCLKGFACVCVGLAHLVFYGRENGTSMFMHIIYNSFSKKIFKT